MSAAAISNAVCVGSGSRSIRWRNSDCRRGVSGIASDNGALTGKLRIGQGRRQLEQRQRVALSLGEQARADRRNGLGRAVSKERGRGRVIQTTHDKLPERRRLEPLPLALPRGKQDCHTLGTQPARREHERVRRR